jgi:hypothetical protein
MFGGEKVCGGGRGHDASVLGKSEGQDEMELGRSSPAMLCVLMYDRYAMNSIVASSFPDDNQAGEEHV